MTTAPFPITTVPPGLISTEDTKNSYKINDLPTRLNGPERKTEYAEYGSMLRFLNKSCSSDENDDHMLQDVSYRCKTGEGACLRRIVSEFYAKFGVN